MEPSRSSGALYHNVTTCERKRKEREERRKEGRKGGREGRKEGRKEGNGRNGEKEMKGR